MTVDGSVCGRGRGTPPRRACRAWAFVAALLHLGVVAVPHAGAQRPAVRSDARASAPFTLGSAAADVVAAMREPPTRVDRLGSLGLEIWHFGASTVKLNWDDGRVVEWSNSDGRLNVHLAPRSAARGDSVVRLGGSADPLLRLHGTPDAVARILAEGTAIWSYGSATVKVSLADRRIIGWTDPERVLALDGPRRVTYASALADAGTEGSRGGPRGRAERSSPAVDRRAPDARSMRPLAPVPGANGPVALDARVGLHDASGDGVLDAGEPASVVVTLRNRGAGTAHALVVRLTEEGGAPSLTTAPRTVARLAAGDSATVQFELTGPHDPDDATRELRLHVTEGNGFDLDPAPRLALRTRAAPRAALAFAGFRADDQSGDGRVAPREITDVTLRIVNRGAGPAGEVRLTIVPDVGTFLADDGLRERSLGVLDAGEHRDVRVAAYTNSRAEELAFTAELGAPDGTGATVRERFAMPLASPITRTIDLDAGATSRIPDSPDGVPVTPDVLERDLPPAAPANPDAIAIVIGVERYRSLPPARYAARDAGLAAEYLVRLFGVPRDAAHLVVRTDEDATSGELRKLFARDGWLTRQSGPDTEVYIYFSGHGAPGVPGSGDSDGYLLPFDGDAAYARETGIGLGDLADALAGLPARRVTVFLDAGFTGRTRGRALLQGGERAAAAAVATPAVLRPGFALFSAARPGQIAGESPELRHGAFTAALLSGLRGGADGDTDGAVTVAELSEHLLREVSAGAARNGAVQEPMSIALEPDRVLVRPGAFPIQPDARLPRAHVVDRTPPTPAALPATGAPATSTVRATQRVLVGEATTREAARQRAIELALADAVRQASGVRVQGSEFRLTGEDSAGMADRFLSVVQLDAAGRVVDYRIDREAFVPVRHPDLGDQLYVEVELTAEVARERGQRDPGFTVELALASPVIGVASGSTTTGGNAALPDELVASLTTSRDAWITVLRVVGDSVTQLLPNALVTQPEVRGGEEAEFPSVAWRERGVHFRASLPAGVDRRDELLVVIATRAPITFLAPRAGGAGVVAPTASMLELQRWLVSVPLEDRAMAVAPYELRRP